MRRLALAAALLATPAAAQDLRPLEETPDIEERVVYERCMALYGLFVNFLDDEAEVARLEEQQLVFLGASFAIIIQNGEATSFDEAFAIFTDRSLAWTDPYIALAGTEAGKGVILSDLAACERVLPVAESRAAELNQ